MPSESKPDKSEPVDHDPDSVDNTSESSSQASWPAYPEFDHETVFDAYPEYYTEEYFREQAEKVKSGKPAEGEQPHPPTQQDEPPTP